MSAPPMSLVFVTPRYGDEVVGGAESGARSLATRLAADGYRVEVHTTCALSPVTWEDAYPEGRVEIDGVVVHRHRVDRPRRRDFDAVSARLLAAPRAVTRDEALAWIDDQGPTSRALLEAVGAVDEGICAFYPYLYHPTVRGLAAVRVPAVLHPAAHPEPPLDLPVFDEVFAGADGLALHSRAEQDLVAGRFAATRAHPQSVVGLPVDGPPRPPDAEPFDEPTALYLGRVDRGKGTDDLVARFAAWRRRGGRGRLVLAGPVVHRPPRTRGVEVRGRVDDDERWELLARADVLVNPSPHESFSLVVPEAWTVGTPVLVNARCAPLFEHVHRGGGGLWYRGWADFDAALGLFLGRDPRARRLGEAGRRYVAAEFSWPAVRTRYLGLLERAAAHHAIRGPRHSRR